MNYPKAKIDRDSALELWLETRSDYAKEQAVLGNVGIIWMVLRRMNMEQDEDLFSVGMVGLLKALNSFDPNKGFGFSTYASAVIRNEILLTFRKKTVPVAFSLDDLFVLDNGDSTSRGDMIADKENLEEDILTATNYQKILNGLNERERKVVKLRIEGKTQKEIADKIGMQQASVSRIIKKIKNLCITNDEDLEG